VRTRGADRAAFVVLLAAIALAWSTAFPGAFQFDDFRVVVHERDVHSWAAWWASMPGIRPLTKASYTLNWTLDPHPPGFVLVGLACHAAGAALVFALVRAWWRDLGPPKAVVAGPLLVALVFALHPAQTEAVTYVAGRSVALAALLSLAALAAWERSRDGRETWRIASAALFAAALAARETAWTVPFAILLVQAARGEGVRATLRDLRWHGIVLVAGALAVAASPTYRRLLATSFDLRGPLVNLVAQVDAIAYLVSHPLLTLRVNIDPDVALAPFAPGWWIAALALLAALVAGFALLGRRPLVAVALLWTFLHLAPTNGVVARLDAANDRQLYLALVGPALLLALAFAPRPRVLRVALALLPAALALATLSRNLDYRSEVALWEATSRASPAKARVWNNLGFAYAEAGDRKGAIAAYARALALDPSHGKARQNLQDLE
jgi:tetratricopeptide (TPR) repeat protein